jgi:acetylornithine/succinyldiaminopimelate/putrescine aminotransferase
VFFCNSGTEGMDAALKFARAARAKAPGPRRAAASSRSTAASTAAPAFALSATYNPPYREPFEPLIPGVRFAPYNDVSA